MTTKSITPPRGLVARAAAASAVLASVASASFTGVACGLSTTGTSTNAESADPTPSADAGDPTKDGGGLNGGPTSNDAGVVFLDSGLPSSMDAGDGAAPDPYASRVSSGLVALYELEENAGTSLTDGIAPAYDLNIGSGGDVAWHSHYLEIKNYTRISSPDNFQKLIDACSASNAVTVEAWVRYTAVESGDQIYGRLITLADSNDVRDLALGNVAGSQWWFSMAGGDDALASNATEALVHTVLVRTPDSNDTLYGYVNGAQVAKQTNTLQPSAMKAYPLSIGDTPGGMRAVKAELHLVAFYGRALSATEITQNFNAGPDPATP